MDVTRRQFFITASVTVMSMVTIGVCAESTTADDAPSAMRFGNLQVECASVATY